MKRIFSLVLAVVLIILVLIPAGAVADGEKRVVRVGWFSHVPLQMNEDGVYSGYNYDYLQELAEFADWEYEYVETTVAEALSMLQNGEIDLVGGMLYSEERDKVYDFSQYSVGQSYVSLFVNQNSDITEYDFKAFNGITIGTVKNATVNQDALEAYSKESGFSYTMVEYDSNTILDEAVKSGEVDAGCYGSFAGSDDFRAVASFYPNPFYFITYEGNTEFLSELNSAISKVKISDTNYENELYEKYFKAINNVKLSDKELEAVKASEASPIRIGVVDGCAPVSYYNDETGEYDGIAVQILKKISEKTGLQFEYVPVKMGGEITEKSPQLVAGAVSTDGIKNTTGLTISDPLFTDSFVLVTKTGNDFTANPKDKTISTMNGFNMLEKTLQNDFSDYKTIKYSSLEEALSKVSSEKDDATIHFRSCVNYLLKDPHYENLQVMPTYSRTVGICVTSLKDSNDVLIRVINKGIKMVSEDEIQSIVLDHTVLNPYELSVFDTMYKYRAALIVIGLLAVLVVASLSMVAVNRRKNEKIIAVAYQKEKEALQVAKLASDAKGNFMSRMSHEIRTPLNAVIGYNTLARNEMTSAKTDAERRDAEMKAMDCLHKSDIASKHLLTIINDVLDMSAIESGKIQMNKERFDFKSLISSITAVFYSQAKEKDIELSITFDSFPEEWVIGDQMRVNQILTNLLSNAVKFTSEGGKVHLLIDSEVINDKVHMIFTVRDTGIGMTPEYLDHIWTPFEQADLSISRRFGGTGLGLSITKTLIDLMGGTIDVKSELGVGSEFKVSIDFDRTEQPVNKETYDFTDINALIVDDDRGTCEYIKLLFDRCEARSAYVNSGKEAIDAFKLSVDNNDRYNLCLIDWRMPNMDGLETAKHIREIAGDEVPIIIITAYDFSEVADKVRELGITMFVSKPLFQSSLFDLLANICGRDVSKVVKKQKDIDFNGARVLLAEDNAMNMEVAKRIMESAGIIVDEAWDGKQALEKFSISEPGTYSVILMDVHMPEMDGHEACRLIRQLDRIDSKTIPIIAMTADAFAENVAQAKEAGMNDHIAKPFDINGLFDTLKNYIK